jgi:hypothetical protein
MKKDFVKLPVQNSKTCWLFENVPTMQPIDNPICCHMEKEYQTKLSLFQIPNFAES